MTIATLATYHKRIYTIVWDAVRSLADQVDEIHININPPIDDLQRWRIEQMVQSISEKHIARIIVHYMDEDLGDLAKFYPLTHPEECSISNTDLILICDDDIIYPPDYAETMRSHLPPCSMSPAEGQEFIISLGGKVLGGGSRFDGFRTSWKQRIGFFEPVEREQLVHIPLTAGVAMLGGHLCYGFDIDTRFRNKGDILLAKYCKEQDIAIVCPAKPADWCKYNPQMAQAETIWGTMLANPEQERDIAVLLNEIFRTPLKTRP